MAVKPNIATQTGVADLNRAAGLWCRDKLFECRRLDDWRLQLLVEASFHQIFSTNNHTKDFVILDARPGEMGGEKTEAHDHGA